MTVLVLAGTAEARELCLELAQCQILAIASLAGVTTLRTKYAVPTRIGGFGGAKGLAEWLRTNDVSALIDATHPFAATMPSSAAEAAEQTRTPRLRLIRREWSSHPDWITAPDIAGAAMALPTGANALLSTGRGEIAPFAARTDVNFILRSIERPGDLPPHFTPLIARPPFTLDAEVETFTRFGITHLVSKNAGGAGQAKLDAAERLSLPVIMVARPSQPKGDTCSTVEDAVAWAVKTIENR